MTIVRDEQDIAELVRLERKFHSTKDIHSRVYGWGKTDKYTDKKMTAREFARLKDILRRNDYVFYPINTSMGFRVGFEVSRIEQIVPGVNPEVIPLLTFREDQLPKGVDFKKVSKVFMEEGNLERASFAGIRIVNDRSHYDY